MYDDLEVFITTYNRAQMLEKALESVCEQTAKGFDIIILDNASTDNTKEIVEKIKRQYSNRNIVFITSEKNMGVTKNINRAFGMAKKEWAMVFHDDDLMHPEYIKNAMNLLNQTPNSVLASCTCAPIEKSNAKPWEVFSTDAYIVDVKDFAALLFGFISFDFASTIYKSSLLHEHFTQNEIYGKTADRPFLFDIAKHGKTIILKDPYIRFGTHPGQDSNTLETGPFEHEWLALLKRYKEILGNNWFDKHGAIYNSFIHLQLRAGYDWMQSVNSKIKYKKFRKIAAQNNVIRKIESLKIVEKSYRLIGSICKKFLYL